MRASLVAEKEYHAGCVRLPAPLKHCEAALVCVIFLILSFFCGILWSHMNYCVLVCNGTYLNSPGQSVLCPQIRELWIALVVTSSEPATMSGTVAGCSSQKRKRRHTRIPSIHNFSHHLKKNSATRLGGPCIFCS